MDDIDVNEEEQEIDVDETSIETIARNATVVVPSSSVTMKEEKQALVLTPPRTLDRKQLLPRTAHLIFFRYVQCRGNRN